MRNKSIKIVPLNKNHIPALKKILIEHVKDPSTNKILWNEANGIKRYMTGKRDIYRRKRNYLVAIDNNNEVLGCAAYSALERKISKEFCIQPDQSLELLNIFVSTKLHKKGIGKKLFEEICKIAKSKGKKLLIVASGLRYKKSWKFYDKVFDKSIGSIKDKYAIERPAKIWQKTL